MGPMIASSLIRAGGSLLGGLFGKKKSIPIATAQGIDGQAMGARISGERYGFNPLTLLGVSQPMQDTGSNYMGQAIADAALMVADGISRNSAEQKLERAERLNSKLQQQVTNLTIRPKVGGIYDQRVATPSVREAVGVPDDPISDRRSDPDASAEPTDLAGGPATRYVVGGVTLEPNPNFSDAERIETRHGDAASWLYGVGTVGADLAYNKDRIGKAFGDAIGAVPIDTMPYSDRPDRWMKREWGRVPDGYDAGQPYWLINGGHSYVAPNGKKVPFY